MVYMVIDMFYKMFYYLENKTQTVHKMLNKEEMLHEVTLKEMFLEIYLVVESISGKI